MSISTSTPVYQHASSFAVSGQLSDASIAAEQPKLNDTAHIGTIRRKAVLSAGHGDPSVQRICSYVNRARSGIWNSDGTLNPDRLRELKTRCVLSKEGIPIITRSIFQAFINERRAIENKSYFPNWLAFGNLAWLPLIGPIKYPVPFTAVTDGSVDALFHAHADQEFNSEKAMTWERIAKFYDPQNSSGLQEKRSEEKEDKPAIDSL